MCECERYCQGGKIVSGTTFRKHYSRSAVRSTRDEYDEREHPSGAVLPEVPLQSCPLLEDLAGIPEPSIPILLDWFREQGIWIHESLDIRPMGGEGGIAVYAVGAGSPQQVGKWIGVSQRGRLVPYKADHRFDSEAQSARFLAQQSSPQKPLHSHRRSLAKQGIKYRQSFFCLYLCSTNFD